MKGSVLGPEVQGLGLGPQDCTPLGPAQGVPQGSPETAGAWVLGGVDENLYRVLSCWLAWTLLPPTDGRRLRFRRKRCLGPASRGPAWQRGGSAAVACVSSCSVHVTWHTAPRPTAASVPGLDPRKVVSLRAGLCTLQRPLQGLGTPTAPSDSSFLPSGCLLAVPRVEGPLSPGRTRHAHAGFMAFSLW